VVYAARKKGGYMGFIKEWKEKIKMINDREELNIEIEDTNRRNYLVLKSGNLRFLISYRSLVALSVGKNYYINSNYTKKNSRNRVSACSRTTDNHFQGFFQGCSKHWSNYPMVDFSEDVDNIPYLRQMEGYLNIAGSF
jgi:hypothetical protein